MKRHPFAWTFAGFILAFVALRFAALATNINDLHTVFPEEQEQATLALNYPYADPPVGPLTYYFAFILETLPAAKQYHGIFLLNNTLVFWLTRAIGWHYYNLHLIALLYALAAYVFWALLMRRHFGMGGFVFFSLLTLAEPVDRVCSSLYLIGSHNEGLALLAACFFLVFYDRRAWTKLLFFGLFGVFFFFYKGTLLLLPLLLLPALRALTTHRQRALAVALFAAGFAPMVVYQMFFGFLSHSLSDGYLEAGGRSIFNLVTFSHFDWRALHLPTCGAPIVRWVLTAVFLAACYALYTQIVRRRLEAKTFAATLLAFPALLWLLLMLADIHPDDRYYWLLYPIIAAVVAAVLSRLPRTIAIPALLGLTALTLPAQLALIEPHNGWLMSRYNLFLTRTSPSINYVPTAEVDFVNWWAAKCPANEGFSLMYQFQNAREGVPPDQPLRAVLDFQENPDRPPLTLTDDDVVSIGMVLALRTGRDEAALPGWLAALRLSPDRLPLLQEGFARLDDFTPAMPCPGR
ncbi:MAG TPA: hypothetical protein PK961_02230 [bacterium]|nr:hypothetical protein [bacterium]